MAAPIDFYFDFSSPYGYFASTRIDALAARYGRKVVWRPFLLGAAMKITGGAIRGKSVAARARRPRSRQPLDRVFTVSTASKTQ
jgi:2-hydroxychromene-2-carboxylate isomerase